MSNPVPLPLVNLSMRQVLRGTGQAVGRHWRRFYGLAVVLAAANAVGLLTTSLIEVLNPAVVALVDLSVLAVTITVTFLFMLKALYFCYGKPFKAGPGLIYLLGHPPYARTMLAIMGVILGFTILISIPLFFGLTGLLLVSALLYVTVRTIVLAPVVVFENIGPVEGFRRAFSLTRAATFRVFFLLILFAVLALMMVSFTAGLTSAGLGPAPEGPPGTMELPSSPVSSQPDVPEPGLPDAPVLEPGGQAGPGNAPAEPRPAPEPSGPPPVPSPLFLLAFVFIVGPLLALAGNFGVLIIYFELTDNTAFRQRLTDGLILVTRRDDGEDEDARDHD